MTGTIWLVAAYASLGLFTAGLALCIIRIARMPAHLRWELAPVPHDRAGASYGGSYFEEPDWWTKPRERSVMNELGYMMKEIFLLHTVWKRHRVIWPFSIALHTGIYCLFFMAFFLLASAVIDMAGFSSAATFLEAPAAVLGAAAYILGCAGSAGMLILRIARLDLRSYSGVPAYLNLAILLALFTTGMASMIVDGDLIPQIRDFIDALLRADTHVSLSRNGAAHAAAVLFFLAVVPFTSMRHFAAKFFTFHTVLWDDRPQNAATEKEVTQLLKRPVSWSAGHVGADGAKNWIDIAKGE